ncbi:MAG: nucleoside deaminase [Pseudonocardiaceae bacterium]
MNEPDSRLMGIAIDEARKSLSEGGVPVGAVIARGDTLLAAGHNERVQRGDPIAHGEIACLRNGGRRDSYDGTTLYTTLSPCEMCSGAILLFKIPRVVVGEATTFRGDLDYLRRRGVEVVLLEDDSCVQLMRSFQQRYLRVWLEDIGEAGQR